MACLDRWWVRDMVVFHTYVTLQKQQGYLICNWYPYSFFWPWVRDNNTANTNRIYMCMQCHFTRYPTHTLSIFTIINHQHDQNSHVMQFHTISTLSFFQRSTQYIISKMWNPNPHNVQKTTQKDTGHSKASSLDGGLINPTTIERY